jgi:hypothetical protein
MQRILNNPDHVVDEMLAGFVKNHGDIVKHVVTGEDNPRGVIAAVDAPAQGKVGVVTGGGSGHKPAFIGYVGKNMCDAAAVGEICSSPTAIAFLEAFRAANGGEGIACLYGNYSGDNMNVKMASKMAKREGITVKTVIANDDVASAPKDQREKRRGVAGEILMWKCGGAKAAKGATLDEVIETAQKAIDKVLSNFPMKWMATMLRWTIFPLGMPWRPPLDSRNRECAAIALQPGTARDRLTAGMYVPKGDDATGRLEAAFVAAIACEPIDEKLRKAVKKGKVVAAPGADVGALAMGQGLISADEYAQWQKKETLRKSVIKVDDFPQDFGRAELVEPKQMVRAA